MVSNCNSMKNKFPIVPKRGDYAARSYSKWWIKVCPAKTESNFISFAIGSDSQSIAYRFDWANGLSDSEIPLPLLDGLDTIYCRAKVIPDGKNGYFGVCFNEQVCCKHYDFDSEEDHTVKKDDTDEWKCTSRVKKKS